MPAQKDLSIWKGNTFRLALRFGSGPSDAFVPRDLTGSVFTFHGVWSATGAIRRQSHTGGWIINAAEGRATLLLTAEETKALDPQSFKYELSERLQNGDEETKLYGTVTLTKWLP